MDRGAAHGARTRDGPSQSLRAHKLQNEVRSTDGILANNAQRKQQLVPRIESNRPHVTNNRIGGDDNVFRAA